VRFIKYGAFTLLTIVSAYLSVNMFINLGSDTIGKVTLGIVAIALEAVKVFSLLRIEYNLYMRAQIFRVEGKKLNLPIASFLMYGALATLSIVASLGFTVVTVDKAVESTRIEFSGVADDYSFEIKQKQDSLALIDSQILALQKQMTSINPDFATGSVKLSTEAQSLASKREALIAEISVLKKQQREAVAVAVQGKQQNIYGMFFLMGQMFGGLSEKTVMYLLLGLVSLLIEIGMIYTSPTIKIRDEEVHEVVKYKVTTDLQASQQAAPSSIMPKTRSRNVAIRTAVQLAAKALEPQIIVEQIRPHIEVSSKEPEAQNKATQPVLRILRTQPQVSDAETIKQFLQKLLTPARGAELKSAALISEETGISVDAINDILVRISKMKSATGKPLLFQKDTAWHLSHMKDLTIGALLKEETMFQYLKGVLHASQTRR